METRGRGRPPLTPEERAQRREQRNAARREARKQARAAALTVVDEIQPPAPALEPVSRWHAVRRAFGFALGAYMPLASYMEVHAGTEIPTRPILWVLVAGCLVFSSISVYRWAVRRWTWPKALGFVVLLEGVLMFCGVRWLSVAGLAILMLLNGISGASDDREAAEEE